MIYTPIPTSFKDELSELTDEEYGRLIRWLQSGETDKAGLTGNERYVADMCRRQVEYFTSSYDRRMETSKENGRKGGRPKKEKPNENLKNQQVILGYEKKPNETNNKDKKEDKDNLKKEKCVKEKAADAAPRPQDNHKQVDLKIQLAENVSMTNAEYKKLLDAYGPTDTARLIEILDNYKGSKGKRYKSDYRAILSWCVDRLEEEKRRGLQRCTSAATSGSSFRDQLMAQIREDEEHDRGRVQEADRRHDGDLEKHLSTG